MTNDVSPLDWLLPAATLRERQRVASSKKLEVALAGALRQSPSA
mgnify:CR=1 FL=1